MAGKKGGLGRGLDALFEDNIAPVSEEGAPTMVRITQVEPNKDQPRKVFDRAAMEELADSIKEHGLLQPILVTPTENGQYQIVAGERRWRASRMAGLEKVPVLIRELSKKQVMEIALIENLQRENLNPMEEAMGYEQLMQEFGMTQEEAASRVGKSRPAVANALRLLQLGDEIRKMVSSGSLSAGHARALLSVKEEAKRLALAKEIVEKDWSVRETERKAKEANEEKKPAKQKESLLGGFAKEAALALSEKMGRQISVKAGKGKSGVLLIPYFDEEDLAALAKKLDDGE